MSQIQMWASGRPALWGAEMIWEVLCSVSLSWFNTKENCLSIHWSADPEMWLPPEHRKLSKARVGFIEKSCWSCFGYCDYCSPASRLFTLSLCDVLRPLITKWELTPFSCEVSVSMVSESCCIHVLRQWSSKRFKFKGWRLCVSPHIEHILTKSNIPLQNQHHVNDKNTHAAR